MRSEIVKLAVKIGKRFGVRYSTAPDNVRRALYRTALKEMLGFEATKEGLEQEIRISKEKI